MGIDYGAFLTNENLVNTMMGQALRTVVGVLLVIVACWLFKKVVYGIFCCKLAHKKGYKGYFFTGFFWGKIGLNYVAALPDMTEIKAIEKVGFQQTEKNAEAPHREEVSA